MYFIVCCLGCCAVGLRCCPCLFVLTPVTFIFTVFLFSAGTVKTQIGNAVDNACNDYSAEIQEFFNRVVDRPMCSDMCPCEISPFSDGGYASMDSDDLADFSRSSFSFDGTHEDAMLFTRNDLDDWLTFQGGASSGYSQLTKKIL